MPTCHTATLSNAAESGLYRPEFEHDACGIGALASITGERSPQMLEMSSARITAISARNEV